MVAVVLAVASFTQASSNDALASPIVAEETLWGLGTAAARTFNQVAVQVRNDTGDAYDGTMRLVPNGVIGFNSLDVIVERDIYLSPGESRWISFAVFLGDNTGDWSIEWDSFGDYPAGSVSLEPASFRRQQVIAVTDAAERVQLPKFPPERFPTKSTLLDAAHILVFPKTPPFQPGQERALAGWLARGGRAIIHSNATGWQGPLAALNRPSSLIRFGNGLVVRRGDDFDTLSEAAIRASFVVNRNATDVAADDAPQRTGPRRSQYAWDLDGEVFMSLRGIVTPSSLAWMFFPMLAAYAAALFTLSLRTVRDRWPAAKYLITLGALVVVACVAFAFASPLSFSDATASASMTFVTDLGEAASDRAAGQLDRVDVRYYGVHRFALSQELKLGDADKPAADARDEELIAIEAIGTRSRVKDSRSQTLTAGVPGLTNAIVRSRTLVDMTPPRWTVTRSGTAPALVPENAAAKSMFPLAALVHSGQTIYRIDMTKPRPGQSTASIPTTRSVAGYLVNPTMLWWEYGYGPPRAPKKGDLQPILDAAGKAIPAFHQPTGTIRPAEVVLPAGVTRIFVLTERPGGLKLGVDDLETDLGYVVWCRQIEEDVTEESAAQ